jgi:hypothetical protein
MKFFVQRIQGTVGYSMADDTLPPVPIRQWVPSVPFPLRFLFAREPAVMSAVLGIVIRAVEARLVARAGYTRARAQTGAVTLIQRFGTHVVLQPLDFIARPGGTGAPAARQPHPLPRRVRPEQPLPRADHPGRARPAEEVRSGSHRTAAAPSHDLGTTSQARVPDRH